MASTPRSSPRDGTQETGLVGPRPVFIGGCGRSGTTLLGAMLGTHPRSIATPESKFRFLPYRQRQQAGERVDPTVAARHIREHWSFKIWGVKLSSDLVDGCASYPDLLLRIVRAYARLEGKDEPALWVDHTPGNVKFASLLFEQFPDAKLIHLVRDGRATAASVMKLDWGPNTVLAAAKWWVDYVTRGLAVESLYGPGRVRRVTYEELVADPEARLRELCDFLEIEFRPEMVDGTGFDVPRFTADQHALVGRRPDAGRLEAWRETLAPREIELFESVAVDLLAGLGYPPLHGWRARRASTWEKVQATFRELYGRHISNRMRLRRRIHRWAEDGPREPGDRRGERI